MSRLFSERAAKISLYVPIALFLLAAPSASSPVATAVYILLELVAFGCGILGVIGGFRYEAPAIIRMAGLGIVLNAIPLVLMALCLVSSCARLHNAG